MLYYLMNKNTVVATFRDESSFGSTIYTDLISVGKLPYGFRNITDWLNHRQAAKHRDHIKSLMRQCGCDALEGFIRVTHCTSINDTFWVKSMEEDVTWENVSLYQNEFNEVISRLAFEGVGLFGEQFSSTTPEFGTSGVYSKCCTKGLDNEMFMYKRGTTGFANAGLEPYGEAFSSPIYDIITRNSVKYELCRYHRRMSSKCKIFTDENVGLVAYSSVGEGNSYPEIIRFYDRYGDGEKFRDMLVADAVCFNTDRHSGNHGVLINNDTLEVLGIAPVYDNNLSMLPYAMLNDFKNIDMYLRDQGPKLGDDWVSVAKAVLTQRARTELINLYGYKIPFDGDSQYSKQRVDLMNFLINRQIKLILGR